MSETTRPPVRVFLGIGSNIERERNIVRGVHALRELLGPLRLSPVYSSAALGFVGDPFLNLVAEAYSPWPLAELATRLRELEYAFGRPPDATRFSARHLDIDLLTYAELSGVYDGILLPREEVLTSAFVLRPLAELAPEVLHPALNLTYADLWAALAPQAPPLELWRDGGRLQDTAASARSLAAAYHPPGKRPRLKKKL